MSETSYRCSCGAEIRYKQDVETSPTTTGRRFTCRDCGTQVPGKIGEKVSHQNPS